MNHYKTNKKSNFLVHCTDNYLPTEYKKRGDIHFGADGITISSPGEPDQKMKNFFWRAAGFAVAAIGIGISTMFAFSKHR